MFYGVIQSTDMRCRNTKVIKFSGRKALITWINAGGEFAHENPEEEQNCHRNIRYVYKLAGRVNRKDAVFSCFAGGVYAKTQEDRLADYLYKYGEAVEV